MKWWIALLAVCAPCLGLLSGCGGGSDETSAGMAPLRVSIAWSERARSLTGPSSALSAEVIVAAALRNGEDYRFTVDRPESADPTVQEYLSPQPVLTGRRTVTVRFRAGSGGQGDVVGVAADVVTIAADGTGLGHLTTVGSVAQVYVPEGQTLREGQARELTVAVRDAQARLLAVTPGSVFWSVLDGTSLVFAEGLARAEHRGVSVVTATVDGHTSNRAPVNVVAAALAQLVPLPPGAPSDAPNTANGVSPDGLWVVGRCDVDETRIAYRWNRTQTAPELLGVMAGYTKGSQANAVNADGTVIVGFALSEGGLRRAFIWRPGDGMRPVPGISDDILRSEALAVSADGRTVAGRCSTLDTQYGWCWSETHGFVLLRDDIPEEEEMHYSDAVAVTADGTTVLMTSAVRMDAEIGIVARAVLYDIATGKRRTLPADGLTRLQAQWISPDGSAVTALTRRGEDESTSGVRWTPASGWVTITEGDRRPVCGSADGMMIAGGGMGLGDAFVWESSRGVRTLESLLVERGVMGGLQGFRPWHVSGVSHDGQVLVGRADSDGGQRGFVVALPR